MQVSPEEQSVLDEQSVLHVLEPTHEHPSFEVPMQSLSLPGSHVSARCGPTDPVQTPQLDDVLSWETSQVSVPALQWSAPSIPG